MLTSRFLRRRQTRSQTQARARSASPENDRKKPNKRQGLQDVVAERGAGRNEPEQEQEVHCEGVGVSDTCSDRSVPQVRPGWPLPQGLDANTFSILDLDSWSEQLEVTGPEVEDLRRVDAFHLHALDMGNVGGSRGRDMPVRCVDPLGSACYELRSISSQKRKATGYNTDIASYNSLFNHGMISPGKPFMQTTSAKHYDKKTSMLPEDDTAIFAKFPSLGEEPWKAFGLYRMVWNGVVKDGEYVKLNQEKQDKVFDIFWTYLKARTSIFKTSVFKDCYLNGANGKQHVYGVSDTQQRALIRTCLEENRGLNVSLSLSVPTARSHSVIALSRRV